MNHELLFMLCWLGEAEHVCIMVHVWRSESVLTFHPVHPQLGGPDLSTPAHLSPAHPIFNPHGHLLYFHLRILYFSDLCNIHFCHYYFYVA